MVIIMTMTIINIHEAKAKLSEYVEAAARGERVLICKRNTPVAELRAVPAGRTKPRPVGGAAARFSVPDAFFDALPNDFLDAFAAATTTIARGVERTTARKRSPRRTRQ
jgi:antitoxin (DNA-binding transcriptional repressor) of toxin-antitoxin stability system